MSKCLKGIVDAKRFSNPKQEMLISKAISEQEKPTNPEEALAQFVSASLKKKVQHNR